MKLRKEGRARLGSGARPALGPGGHASWIRGLVSGALLVPAALSMSAVLSGASAQVEETANGSVVIDYSVLGPGGGGIGGFGGVPGGLSQTPPPGGLLLPGSNAPRSTLHVTPNRGAAPSGRASSGAQRSTFTPPPPSTAPKSAPKTAAKKAPARTAAAKPAAKAPPAVVAPPPPTGVVAPPPPAVAPPPAPTPLPKAAEKPKADQKVAARAPTPPPAPPKPAPDAKTPGASRSAGLTPPTPPPPPPAPTAAGTPKPPVTTAAAKTAAPPAAGGADSGAARLVRVEFDTRESRLPKDAEAQLLDLANKIKDDSAVRLQLLAYAADDDLSSNRARRLSLSRALAVRSFLIENGIRSTRIDVRALGKKSPGGPAHRVDVSKAER